MKPPCRGGLSVAQGEVYRNPGLKMTSPIPKPAFASQSGRRCTWNRRIDGIDGYMEQSLKEYCRVMRGERMYGVAVVIRLSQLEPFEFGF
jgi:hypothetical protein